MSRTFLRRMAISFGSETSTILTNLGKTGCLLTAITGTVGHVSGTIWVAGSLDWVTTSSGLNPSSSSISSDWSLAAAAEPSSSLSLPDEEE